jgi:hypothetical protein
VRVWAFILERTARNDANRFFFLYFLFPEQSCELIQR